MKHPFQQKKVNGKLIREFSDKVSSDELVWHRDRADRNVYVKKCEGWKLQLENKLPVTLKQGSVYYIPKNTYHRIIKGRNSLIVEIQESSKMKITKRQLRRIIREAMPAGGVPDVVGAVTGVYGEEQRQLLNDLGDMYSDMHKELHGRRPNIPMFKNVEEAQAAVDEIWQEYAESNRRDEELVQNNQAHAEMEKRIQDLMPDDYDVELPMHSGMGRRSEGFNKAKAPKMKITKRQLRRIIREAIPGKPIRMASGNSFSSSTGPIPWQKGSSEYKDTIVMSPNADSVLVNGTETYIEDVPQELSIASGFPMEGNDPDNLIFALEEMMQDGYVELEVTYANGQWGW